MCSGGTRARGSPLAAPGGLIARAVSVTSCAMHAGPQRPAAPRLRIRIVFGTDARIGPGKADLLEGVARHGSIAAAGREMGMSYKRAWALIGTLNAMFRAPLVESSRGGPGGGGAVLTQLGREVLAQYRAVEAEAAAGSAARLERLEALLGDMPGER
jgi:molybdate transport system regulatory protein